MASQWWRIVLRIGPWRQHLLRERAFNFVRWAFYFVVPANAGTHNHRWVWLDEPQPQLFTSLTVGVMGPGSRGACHRARIRATRWLGRDDDAS